VPKYYVAMPRVSFQVATVIAADRDAAMEIADGADLEEGEEFVDLISCDEYSLPPEFGGYADPDLFTVKEIDA